MFISTNMGIIHFMFYRLFTVLVIVNKLWFYFRINLEYFNSTVPVFLLIYFIILY